MKISLISLICLLLITSIQAQNLIDYRRYSKTGIGYWKGKKYNTIPIEEKEYDKKGRKIKDIDFLIPKESEYGGGAYTSFIVGYGNLDDDEWNNHISYKYNRKGELTQEYYDGGKSPSESYTNEYIYGYQGKKMGKNQYDANRKLSRRTIFKYNNDNLLITKITSDKDSKILNKETYSYNDQGFIIHKKREGTYSSLILYEYDDRDSLLQQVHITKGQEAHRYEYSYDKETGMCMDVYYKSGYSEYTTKYAYDEKNRIVKEGMEISGKYRLRYAYTYNDKGQLVSKAYYRNKRENSDKPHSTTYYTYDEWGRILTERIHDENEALCDEIMYEYK